MKTKLLILALALAPTLFGQQDEMFTHYSFNTMHVNPAYAGSRDALTLVGLHRSQWVTFPGAPVSQTFSAHSPIFKDKIGLGVSLSNDKLGPNSNQGYFVDLSYRLKLGTGNLAFGLKGGVNSFSSNLDELYTNDAGDQQFAGNIQSSLIPNFGFGVYYSTERFYAGVSSPRLLENQYLADNINSGSQERHYYFIAGGMLDIAKSKNIQLKPTTFVKYVEGAPIQFDLTALVYFNNRAWVGPMFRSGDSFGGLAGLNITDQLGLGYVFDWSFANRTGTYNSGSHEVMLRHDFIFKDKGVKVSPRYF